MSEGAAPSSAADVPAAQPRDRSLASPVHWPRWLKALLATVGVTLLTAWLFPALSTQWQDRQRARELSAGLVSQIGKNTSNVLITSSFITNNRFTSSEDPSRKGFNQEVFNDLDLAWRTSSAEIEAQLQAYFPDAVVERWRAYSSLVWRTYRLITDNKSTRQVTVDEIAIMFENDLLLIVDSGPKSGCLDSKLPEYLKSMRKPWWDDYSPSADKPRGAYFCVSRAVLNRSAVVIDEILASHPAGFSTRSSDLVRNLLPVFAATS